MSRERSPHGFEQHDLWTMAEVARFLRVPIKTVYRWRAERFLDIDALSYGEAPRSGEPDRRPKYFRRDDVIAWRDANLTPAGLKGDDR